MIEPTEKDIGRGVVYQAGHPGAPAEDGIITSFNDYCVFVRFKSPTSQGCKREDLRWLSNNQGTVER